MSPDTARKVRNWLIALGVVGALLLAGKLEASLHSTHVTELTAYIGDNSKTLLYSPSCTVDGNGDAYATALVGAPNNSGVLKIVAYMEYRSPSGPSTYPNQSWYAYFNTDDPTYASQGSGVLTVALPFDTTQIDPGSVPLYCMIKVVSHQHF